MRLLSWNVNGIRAVIGKGFGDFVATENPDILCLQETKARPEQVQLPLELAGYHDFWNSAEKPGYSGVAVFTRKKPLDVKIGLGVDRHDREGRVLTLEYADFILVNVYTPNAQDELRRLDYRLDWDEAFREHLVKEATRKPVIFCGDLNVAHHEIDLARPNDNRRSPGFSDEERQSFGTAIFNHQAVGFRLADCATQLEAARQLIWHAASLHDAGRPCLKEAAMAKLFASEAAEMVCSAAIQTLGGYGYVSDFPVERIYRDVRVCQIYEGTSDVQKIIIQRAL